METVDNMDAVTQVRINWSGAQIAHALAIFGIIALVYLVVLLWADYVTTIVSAIILAQALYLPRKGLEERLAETDSIEVDTDTDDGAILPHAISRIKRVAIDLWSMPLLFLAVLLLLQLGQQMWRMALMMLGCGMAIVMLLWAMRRARGGL